MNRFRWLTPLLIAAFATLPCLPAQAQSKSPAAEPIRSFYKQLLDGNGLRRGVAPRLSKAFTAEIRETAALCKKYGEGPCGWGAGGNEYLDAQEYDPALSFDSAQVRIRQIGLNMVTVKLNVYPSQRSAAAFYDRTLIYKMMLEDGQYVVDDITQANGTARARLANERTDMNMLARASLPR